MPANTPKNKPVKGPPNRKLTPEMKIRQWKPGQSGNPLGRPHKLTDELNKMLDEKVPNDPAKRKYFRLFVESVLKRAITKSDVLAKEVFDRVEGKLGAEEERSSNTVQVLILDVPRPDRSAFVGKPAWVGKPAQADKPAIPVKKLDPSDNGHGQD